jgi:hypothetical protein
MEFSFGINKNKKISDVMKNNKQYCDFLMKQSWFPKKYPKEYEYIKNYKEPFNFFECMYNNLDTDCLDMISVYLTPKFSDYQDLIEVKEYKGNKFYDYKDKKKIVSFMDEIYYKKKQDGDSSYNKPLGIYTMSFNALPIKVDPERVFNSFHHRRNILEAIQLSYKKPTYKDENFLEYHERQANIINIDFIVQNRCTNGESIAETSVKYIENILMKDIKELGDQELSFGKHKGRKYKEIYSIKMGYGWYIDYLQNKTKFKNNILENQPQLKLYIDVKEWLNSERHTRSNLYN